MSTTQNNNRMSIVASSFSSGAEVNVDPWSVNVLADDLEQSNAWVYAQAIADGPPPKMFANGTADLPAFTASGIDPQLLLQVPGLCRHALAAEPNIAVVQASFEQDSTNPTAAYASAGLASAVQRMRVWAAGTFDSVAALSASLAANETRDQRQAAIDAAFATGGAAASNALIRQYQASDAAAATAQEQKYQSWLATVGLKRIAAGGYITTR